MSLAAIAFAAAATIVTANPVEFQDVTMHVALPGCYSSGGENVRADSLDPTSIRVGVPTQTTCNAGAAPDSNPASVLDIRIGAFPMGNYRVQLNAGGIQENLAFTVQPLAEIAVFPPPPHPLVNYSGAWYSAAESGWGLTIDQSPLHQVFVVLYVYDAQRNPQWYSIQGGRWTSSTVWSNATVYMTSGPPLASATFNPDLVKYSAVGTASLDFSDVNGARLDYTINGLRLAKSIERLTAGNATLRLTVDSCAWAERADVSMRGDGIHVSYPLNKCFAPGTPRQVDVQLGALPAGTYRVYLHADMSVAPTDTLTYVVPEQPVTLDGPWIWRSLANYSGLWLDPRESGWGLSVTNQKFAVLYAYGADGKPEWFTLQAGNWRLSYKWGADPAEFGFMPFDIYRTTGSSFDSATFDPKEVSYTKVGTGSIDFANAFLSTGRTQLTYTINGVRATKSIERLLAH